MLEMASVFLNAKFTPFADVANSPTYHSPRQGVELLIYKINELLPGLWLSFSYSPLNVRPKPIVAYVKLN